jgi:hypothetical protein
VVLIMFGLAGCGQSGAPIRVESFAATPEPATPAVAATLEAPESFEAGPSSTEQEPEGKKPEWTSLFDGETLGNWQATQFGGEAEIMLENGMIVLPAGEDMTGITWKGQPPARMDYEIEVEAKLVDGYDFFCGLTFPVGKDWCSLICGGWSGTVTGLSNVDGEDAARNATKRKIDYEKGQWYRIRVRVAPNRIEAWLDDESIVDIDTTNRKISIRGEVEPSKPLGIATWRTTGAIRAIRFRKLPSSASPAEPQSNGGAT